MSLRLPGGRREPRSRARGVWPGLLVTAFAVLVSAEDAAVARLRLERMRVPFTVERFVQVAAQGDLTTVDAFLEAGMGADTPEPGRLSTALLNAAGQGHLRVVRRLLEGGVSVDRADVDGVTALVNACHYGRREVVAALLEAGASVNVQPRRGPTALVAAAYGGHKDASEAWMAGALTTGAWPAAAGDGSEWREIPEDLRDAWEERAAIIECDGGLSRSVAEQAAWRCLTDALPQ